MELSEEEKAILAIEALANQIGERGIELKNQVLLNIAADLQLFMISAIGGDLNSFLEHVNSFRENKIKELNKELEYLKMEIITGKKITSTEKIARMDLGSKN